VSTEAIASERTASVAVAVTASAPGRLAKMFAKLKLPGPVPMNDNPACGALDNMARRAWRATSADAPGRRVVATRQAVLHARRAVLRLRTFSRPLA
jgi:hypothetical protein